MKTFISLSGISLFFSFILSILYEFKLFPTLFISGALAFFSATILFYKLSSFQKLFISLLFLLGLIFWAISYKINPQLDLTKMVTANQFLLTLLIGVHFLRLISFSKKQKEKELPKGKDTFFKTYLSIHLFGSIINLSSVLLVADNLYKKAKLSKEQLIVLTRAFSSDAFWSPFFVAFAAAITYAPNTQVSYIIFYGIFISFIAFLFTYFELKKSNIYSLNNFVGYPISMETLWLPFTLLILVLIFHNLLPNIKVIVLISFFCILITFITLLFTQKFKDIINKFSNHIVEKLPSMYSELILFLVAGLFGTGVSNLLLVNNITLPFDTLNALTSSLTLLAIILVSFIGIHPIISISILGNLLNNIDANHTFMATMFLMSWAISVGASPISGLNLTLQARYKVNLKDIYTINIKYALFMYIICVIFLVIIFKFI